MTNTSNPEFQKGAGGIVKSVKIQLERDNSQIFLPFPHGKSPREAMEAAEKEVKHALNIGGALTPRRRAGQYGEMSWTLYAGNKFLAWVDMSR